LNQKNSGQNTLIAAERRRKIYAWALQQGSVNATWLAQTLGVRPATIRHDLEVLQREGKLIRSHGGAIIKDAGTSRPPYSQTRRTNLEQKSWIGAAALQYLPESGTIFIGAGSTTYQLATRMPENRQLHVVTNSAEVAIQLTSTMAATVDLLGGRIRPDSFATNCLLDPALEMLYWDVAFIGAPAVDVERGISTVDQDGALTTRKIIEHASKVILMCDSSKFGRLSYAKIGPVTLIHVLITDVGASPEIVRELSAQGVEVVTAGPPDSGREGEPPGGDGGRAQG